MDMDFMDEYYERMRADEIDVLSGQRNDDYADEKNAFNGAIDALIEGLGLAHIFDGSHNMTSEEKKIWLLFDAVAVHQILARDALLKGAYMLGAEDREKMLR